MPRPFTMLLFAPNHLCAHLISEMLLSGVKPLWLFETYLLTAGLILLSVIKDDLFLMVLGRVIALRFFSAGLESFCDVTMSPTLISISSCFLKLSLKIVVVSFIIFSDPYVYSSPWILSDPGAQLLLSLVKLFCTSSPAIGSFSGLTSPWKGSNRGAWWRHQWKHFPRNWPFVRGIHRSPVNSPHKGQWRKALIFSLICVWINVWVNNREAGDLRRYRAHYDVIVMWIWIFDFLLNKSSCQFQYFIRIGHTFTFIILHLMIMKFLSVGWFDCFKHLCSIIGVINFVNFLIYLFFSDGNNFFIDFS